MRRDAPGQVGSQSDGHHRETLGKPQEAAAKLHHSLPISHPAFCSQEFEPVSYQISQDVG